jgi:SAM-dependent methyltransferase
MFGALARRWPVQRALYPGSYVDLSPSTAIPSVTYVDSDARAARFFSDDPLVRTQLAEHTPTSETNDVHFIAADYTQPLDVPEASMDLLISLYTGPMYEHCRRYLRPGGLLLANASHGDASLAALDPTLSLVAVAQHRDGRYRMTHDRLDGYLHPKRPETADVERIRRSGRGIAYTRSAFAYVFQSD